MATHEFEKVIEKACADLDIAGCALLATNRDASLTKLLTTLAVLHLASTNNLSLDDPDLISNHLPELAIKSILLPPAADGTLSETPRTKPITLRHLLTHTSGLVYDQMALPVILWIQANNKDLRRGGTVLERFDSPLAFEPGDSWMYGPNLDYAGLLIERMSGKTLEEYMNTNLLAPLGIKDLTFHLSKRPELQARLAPHSYRRADGKVAATPERPEDVLEPWLTTDGKEAEGYFGGQNGWTTGAEYIKVLRGVLDGSLIPPAYADDFFAPQLNEAQADALNGLMQMDQANNMMGHVRKTVRKNWGLAGLLLDADDHDKGRKAGTLIWAGMPMLQWFVDRKTDLCGLFVTQIAPMGDPKAAEITDVFVDGIYALASEGGA